MPNFDAYADKYVELHNQNIKLSGQPSSYFVKQKIEFLKTFADLNQVPEEMNILDFGCGIGRSYPEVKSFFPKAKYIGLDSSEHSIALAKKSYPETIFKFYQGFEIPIESNSMDFVFAACVFHHIPPLARHLVYKEIFRVLKPGGFFSVFEHNPYNPLTLYVVRQCEFDDDAILLTPAELKKSLKRCSFDIHRLEFTLFLPAFLKKKFPKLEKKLWRLPIGAQYCVIGKKPVFS